MDYIGITEGLYKDYLGIIQGLHGDYVGIIFPSSLLSSSKAWAGKGLLVSLPRS